MHPADGPLGLAMQTLPTYGPELYEKVYPIQRQHLTLNDMSRGEQ